MENGKVDVIFYLGYIDDPMQVKFDFEYIYNKAKELGFQDEQEFDRYPIIKSSLSGEMGIRSKLFNFFESKGMKLTFEFIKKPKYKEGDIFIAKFFIKYVCSIDGKIKYRTDLLADDEEIELCQAGAFDQIFTGSKEELIDERYIITKIGKIR